MNSDKTRIRKTRMRLVVALPVVMSGLALAAGFLAINIIEWKRLAYYPSTGGGTLDLARAYIVLIGVGAGILGFVIAQYISKTLNRITSTLMDIGMMREESPPLGKDEITSLSGTFDRALLSVSEFVSDKYILDNLEEGIISIDAGGIITYINHAAEKMLSYSAAEHRWVPFAKCLPAIAQNRELLSIVAAKEEVGQKVINLTLHDQSQIRVAVSTRLVGSVASGSSNLILSFRNHERLDEMRSEIMQVDRLASLGFLIGDVAHEIRTPLGYIRGLGEIFRQEVEEGSPKAQQLDALLRGVDRLNTLAEQLLTLSNKNSFHPLVNVDVKKETGQVRLECEKELSEKGLRLIEDYQEGELFVKATSQGIQRILSNLVGNAIQHTPPDGSIKITARLEDGNILISIFNSGSYISPEQTEKIFTPFFTTHDTGTGLGLFITRHLVESFQGNIDVKSSPEQGTTFAISFPPAGSNAEK